MDTDEIRENAETLPGDDKVLVITLGKKVGTLIQVGTESSPPSGRLRGHLKVAVGRGVILTPAL